MNAIYGPSTLGERKGSSAQQPNSIVALHNNVRHTAYFYDARFGDAQTYGFCQVRAEILIFDLPLEMEAGWLDDMR